MKLLPHMKATHRPAPAELQSVGSMVTSVEVIATKPGDVLIIRAPEKYVCDTKTRETIVELFTAGLKELGVRAVIIPEWMKLELLMTSEHSKAET